MDEVFDIKNFMTKYYHQIKEVEKAIDWISSSNTVVRSDLGAFKESISADLVTL